MKGPAWVWGLCIAIVSAFCGALGGIMIRKAFAHPRKVDGRSTSRGNEERETGEEFSWYYDEEAAADDFFFSGTGSAVGGVQTLVSVLKNPIWLTGIVLTTVLNPLGTIAALSLAPATLVTCNAGVHVLFNMMLAKLWLREATVALDYVGSVAVAAGMCLVIIFSGKDQPVSTAAAYVDTLKGTGSIVYCCTMLTILLITGILSLKQVSRRFIGGAAGAEIQRFCLCLTSGIAGGNANLGAKGVVVSVMEMKVMGWKGALSRLFPYLTFLLTVCLALTQLVYLNMSLSGHAAVFVVPTTNSVLIVIGTIGAIVVLREAPTSTILLTTGLLLIVGGVFCLAYGKNVAQRKVSQTVTRPSRSMFVAELDDRLLTALSSDRHFLRTDVVAPQERRISLG
eukprot:GHVU01181089.1.p1 GENE.GHVU01181089.1~~GHVU01181089.1.p1  ORF type:complete len:396 (-),score=32.07 GHVU01181089.1:734-1921(-)